MYVSRSTGEWRGFHIHGEHLLQRFVSYGSHCNPYHVEGLLQDNVAGSKEALALAFEIYFLQTNSIATIFSQIIIRLYGITHGIFCVLQVQAQINAKMLS
jgi:hypothetical protein